MVLVCYADDTPLPGVCDRSGPRYPTAKPVNSASSLVHRVDAMRVFHSHCDVNTSNRAPPPFMNAPRSVVRALLIFLLWGFHKNKAKKFGTDAKTTQNKLSFCVGVSFTAPRLAVGFILSAENHSSSHGDTSNVVNF